MLGLRYGDFPRKIEVAVLGIDRKGEQMSLGMKQTQNNPWDNILERYPIDGSVKGKVRNLTNYGAFVELEEGIDGLLHVSDMSWTRKISHPNEMLEKGEDVECKILAVDPDRRRIALGMNWKSRFCELTRKNERLVFRESVSIGLRKRKPKKLKKQLRSRRKNLNSKVAWAIPDLSSSLLPGIPSNPEFRNTAFKFEQDSSPFGIPERAFFWI